MRHKILAGLVLGLICLIKPHFGLFLPWAFLRGEWRFAVACLGVVSAGLAASIAEFGWANHIDYLRLLSFISERGEAYYPNQSINGLLNRLMSLREPELYKNMAFVAGSFPPFNPWVYWGTLISSVAVLFAAILRIGGKRDRVIDFCILAVSITIAAPIAWEHHYGIFLPVFAVVFAGPPRSRRWLILIIASYVLISNYFPVANLLAETVLNPVQSYVLAGGLVLLVLLHFGAGEPVSGEQALSGSSTS